MSREGQTVAGEKLMEGLIGLGPRFQGPGRGVAGVEVELQPKNSHILVLSPPLSIPESGRPMSPEKEDGVGGPRFFRDESS